MAGGDHLARVRDVRDQDDLTRLYDDWAGAYDADLAGEGYVGPARVAAEVARLLDGPDRAFPILDYGCGTGLLGRALADAGLSRIDGCDVSDAMLDRARQTGVYGRLWAFDPEDPPRADALRRDYAVICACGAIAPGAAPPATLHHLWDATGEGMTLVFTWSAQAGADPDYAAALDAVLARATVISDETGPHLHGATARVIALRRG